MDTSFDRTEKDKGEWLTPPHILKALGPFDLDPCAPVKRPWDMAARHFTIMDNGLMKAWEGRVWCNPPYGSDTGKWLARLAEHGNGIALIFARTETAAFFNHIWPKADAIMFLKGRLTFYSANGRPAKRSAGSPSCLVAYGKQNIETLLSCSLEGKILIIEKEKTGLF